MRAESSDAKPGSIRSRQRQHDKDVTPSQRGKSRCPSDDDVVGFDETLRNDASEEDCEPQHHEIDAGAVGNDDTDIFRCVLYDRLGADDAHIDQDTRQRDQGNIERRSVLDLLRREPISSTTIWRGGDIVMTSPDRRMVPGSASKTRYSWRDPRHDRRHRLVRCSAAAIGVVGDAEA